MMANNYFHFKQFTINQEGCGMKVCTDSCIFGSWMAARFSEGQIVIQNCLDIGTGTGLLALMFAQKNPVTIIDAVEIEENGYARAKENFSNSQWHSRLDIFHSDIRQFSPGKKYDLIITNPPFYENELRSPDKNKNVAKHDGGLRLSELITTVKKHLAQNGHFSLLLPYQRVSYFEDLAEINGLFACGKLLIRQTPGHNYFRGILVFSTARSEPETTELTIKTSEGKYTKEFTRLLSNYYLKL